MFSIVNAQDVLITKEGDALKVWEVEISNNAVFYREQQTEDSPIKRINKNDLLMIKLQSGEKIIIGEETKTVDKTPAPTAASESASKIITISNLSPEAKAANDKIISTINAKDKIKILDDKSTEKKSNVVFARFLSTKNSVFTNEDIEVSAKEISFYYYTNIKAADFSEYCSDEIKEDRSLRRRYVRGIIFFVKNKTNNPIFIDLGKSYFSSNSGSETYYVPTASSTHNSSSVGTGINLGNIADAFGVGGVVGAISNGINISGSKTAGTTNTVYSQRIISIPPMGKISLPHKKIVNKETIETEGIYVFNTYSHGGEGEGNVKNIWLRIKRNSKNEFISGGLVNEISYENSPLKISNFISYSFKEDCNISKSIKQELYIGEIIGLPYSLALPGHKKLQKEVSWSDDDIIVYPIWIDYDESKGLRLQNMTTK